MNCMISRRILWPVTRCHCAHLNHVASDRQIRHGACADRAPSVGDRRYSDRRRPCEPEADLAARFAQAKLVANDIVHEGPANVINSCARQPKTFISRLTCVALRSSAVGEKLRAIPPGTTLVYWSWPTKSAPCASRVVAGRVLPIQSHWPSRASPCCAAMAIWPVSTGHRAPA
jgi:hypothetical protein